MEHAYFLVQLQKKEETLDKKWKDMFISYLEKEGFTLNHNFWGCPWFFVDIKEKIYIPGRPGISYGYEIGNHAITFEEFKVIYNIYKKHGRDSFFINLP